jgi:copper chaperone NosL
MNRSLFTAHCLLITFLLAACSSQPAGPRPPEIIYGQDICEQCGMIISEAKYAAATLVENGDPRKFESIGDMVVYHMEHPDQKVEAWFVHDYNTDSWIRAETAFYVLSERIQSPMPPGLAAFEAEDDAEAFAATVDSVVLSFDEMRGQVHVAAHS